MNGLYDLSYGEMLKNLNIFSFRGRLLRADLIKYWKIMCFDESAFDLSVMFQRSIEERTRGHRYNLVVPQCNTDIRQHFLNVHSIQLWISLPGEFV